MIFNITIFIYNYLYLSLHLLHVLDVLFLYPTYVHCM